MYDPYTDDWKRELGMAAAAVLRAVARAMPMFAAFAAAGFYIHFLLSGPFEFTCKSTIKPDRQAEATLRDPKAPAPALLAPVMPANE